MTAAPVSARCTSSQSPSRQRREIREAEGQPLPGRGAGPAGERRLGDHRERPLGPDQEPSQVRPGGRARHRPAAQDLAVRQDRGQPEQHVLDRPEPGGRLPGRRRGDPAAHRGDGDRLRVVAGGQPVFGQFLLQPVAAHAGLDVDRLGHRVDVGRCGPSGTGPGRPTRRRACAPPQTPEPAPRGITAVAVWPTPRPGPWPPPRCGPGR